MNSTPAATVTQAEALHLAADLIAAHPNLPTPYVTSLTYSDGRGHAGLSWQLLVDGLNQEEQKSNAALIVRTIGGKWDKEQMDDRFYFKRKDGPLSLCISVEREAVCERIVKGTETVTIPAKEATPERTEVVELVEWRCEPLLAEVSA
jgi:hypothetical protein